MKTMSSKFFEKANQQSPIKKTNFIPAKTKEGSSIVAPAPINQTPKTPTIETPIIPSINKPILTIDLIPESHPHPALVKLFFSEKPPTDTRLILKARSFWYHPNDNGWSHIDTPETRKWVNEFFNAELEIEEAPEYNDKIKPALEEFKTATNAPGDDIQGGASTLLSPEFVVMPESPLERYHRQIDALTERLKCSVSGLALIAIDRLYQCEFPG